jgi:hypothetical protein
VTQQQVPPEVLGRISAIVSTISYSLGATAYAVIGPVADVVGVGRMLGFAACYAIASSAVVLALPAIRDVPWRDGPPGTAPRPAGQSARAAASGVAAGTASVPGQPGRGPGDLAGDGIAGN